MAADTFSARFQLRARGTVGSSTEEVQTCTFGAVGWVAGLTEAAFFAVVDGEEDEVADLKILVFDAFADCEEICSSVPVGTTSRTFTGYVLALMNPAPS